MIYAIQHGPSVSTENQTAIVGACQHGHRWENGAHSWRIGKKAAGRLLDGVLHDEYPE